MTLERATQRDERQLRDPEPITALHRAFAELGRWSGHSVNTADRSQSAVAALLREQVPTGAFRAD